MVRIENNRRGMGDLARVGLPGSGKVEKGAAGGFEKELLTKQDNFGRQRMQELLQEIDGLAGRLAESLDLTDLLRYRRAVKEFLKEATSRAYLLQEERGWARRGGRSLLVTVQKVNDEIEELLRSFASRKDAPMEVLQTLDKVRGMLVDLLV